MGYVVLSLQEILVFARFMISPRSSCTLSPYMVRNLERHDADHVKVYLRFADCRWRGCRLVVSVCGMLPIRMKQTERFCGNVVATDSS